MRVREAREEKIFLENQRNLFWLVGRKQDVNAAKYHPTPDELTAAQRVAADEYARTGKIPAMITEGREPFEMGPIAGKAGYLRYPKIYAGADSVLISENIGVGAGSSRVS